MVVRLFLAGVCVGSRAQHWFQCVVCAAIFQVRCSPAGSPVPCGVHVAGVRRNAWLVSQQEAQHAYFMGEIVT